MARVSQDKQFESTVARIVASTANEIAQAVRQNIADEVARMVGQGTAGNAGTRGRRKILCPVCGKPGGGPRWRWACADHRHLSKAKLREARAKARAAR